MPANTTISPRTKTSLAARLSTLLGATRGSANQLHRRQSAEPGSLAVSDNTFYQGGGLSGLYRDRYEYDRATIIAECLRAWRVNPLARQIVKLTTAFVIGDALRPTSEHRATDAYLSQWWNHRLNNMPKNSKRFMDELTRAGNLFFLITVTPDGMTYIRGVPAESIKEIQTADNDIEQEW